MKTKIVEWVKKETVLVVAWVLALLSMFFVPPDGGYVGYVDTRTLLLLFSLMGVTAGCRALGLFHRLGEKLLCRAKSTRQLEFLLVMLCFFSSMLITNDVALITFVPFAVSVLRLAGQSKRILFVVTMQTVAANLGSMLLPVGNPQNIYLYTQSGASVVEFVLLMLPYTVASFLLLCGSLLLRKNRALVAFVQREDQQPLARGKLAVYGVLFVLCLLAVLRVLPAWVAFAAVLVVLLAMDAPVLRQVDYALLATFVGFFVFVGNMGRIPLLRQGIETMLLGHEALVSAALSQVISNVPAVLLLSGFTDAWQLLLVGVNIGGLGTLIASMASLISYKCIAREYPEQKGRYLALFTGVNVVFLVILLLLCLVLTGGL